MILLIAMLSVAYEAPIRAQVSRCCCTEPGLLKPAAQRMMRLDSHISDVKRVISGKTQTLSIARDLFFSLLWLHQFALHPYFVYSLRSGNWYGYISSESDLRDFQLLVRALFGESPQEFPSQPFLESLWRKMGLSQAAHPMEDAAGNLRLMKKTGMALSSCLSCGCFQTVDFQITLPAKSNQQRTYVQSNQEYHVCYVAQSIPQSSPEA